MSRFGSSLGVARHAPEADNLSTKATPGRVLIIEIADVPLSRPFSKMIFSRNSFKVDCRRDARASLALMLPDFKKSEGLTHAYFQRAVDAAVLTITPAFAYTDEQVASALPPDVMRLCSDAVPDEKAASSEV